MSSKCRAFVLLLLSSGILLTATDSDPARRYASAREMRTALAAYLITPERSR